MGVGGLISERRSYVAGRWIDGEDSLAVENPADESRVTDVSITPAAEFRRAIAEARWAFDEGPWAAMPPTERARTLHAFVDHVEANGAALSGPLPFGEVVRRRRSALLSVASARHCAQPLRPGRQDRSRAPA